ncbi:hypothetical protein [Jeongeupia sp. USM3]|uniref:hypothetical protein n=1 Tax=Jeongeupia sp. USM3 TaxID=1906741 RepID=UPI0011AB4A33|nr:hypothetical protein [Jeongeupia sp. USM3]
MNAVAIAFAVTLPFLGIVFVTYRKLQRMVYLQKITPVLAVFVVWLAVLGLPWFSLWFWVPVANHIVVVFPALRTPSWDAGLAISLYLGMCMSYLFGALAAGAISWQFIRRSTHGRSDNAS